MAVVTLSAEEQAAWDQYASAALMGQMADPRGSRALDEVVTLAAGLATCLILERRKPLDDGSGQ